MFDLVPFGKKNVVNTFFDEFERNFWPELFKDNFFENRLAGFKADIYDNGDEYVIEAELAGFAKEDIDVQINEDRLTISAKKDETVEDKNANYIRKERRSGLLTRSFILDNVKRDEIKAEFKDGILKLNLPKIAEDAQKNRRIDIN